MVTAEPDYRIIRGDALDLLSQTPVGLYQCIFADPPDNLGLKYSGVDDNRDPAVYLDWLCEFIHEVIKVAPIVWLSINARWILELGATLADLKWLGFEIKPCVQVFTFGQHNSYDLGNNHRPLVRLRREDAPIYPDAIRVKSERQKAGDKRADLRGRVPGDVFDFPRVTNSGQRRKWHPTQLHEGLVERCIKLSTKPGERVLDPFAGTGTTLRVCKRIGRPCTLFELSEDYCQRIAEEHGLKVEGK